MLRRVLLLAAACLALGAAPSRAALWEAERVWTEEEEAGFAAFVEQRVDSDFFLRARLAHDCADILYGLRWIYARERRLPAAASAPDGTLVGHWSERFGPAGHGDWTRDGNFLAALRFVFGLTGTRTLPLEIFGRVKKGLDPSLNAISTVFILVTVLAVFLTEALRRRNP